MYRVTEPPTRRAYRHNQEGITMAKKSKHMTGAAFSVEVCDAIRHHTGCRRAMESKRDAAFEDRDAAVAEKGEIADRESHEYEQACKRHSDAIEAIDDLSAQIKFHRNQVDTLIEKSDEPELEFMYDMPAEMKPSAKAKAKKEKDAEQLKLSDGKAAEGVAEGLNEHLKVSLAELELDSKIERCLQQAGYVTVYDLVVQIDGDAGLPDIKGVGGVGQAAILKAVKSYRKRHRQADAAVEKELAGAGT